MDERAALRLLAADLPGAGDDAAVIDDLVFTIDMLHEESDFPEGTTHYTAGWRAVGASLSDLAAMGAEPTGAVAVYAVPAFIPDKLDAFIFGAREVCDLVGTDYVGGDLDHHDEFTVVSAAVGRTEAPVYRRGAVPGDVVCVTGTLGRTAAALKLFERGDIAGGNELFRFEPRIAAGRALAPYATAMMDSSDGLARSLHQLAEASDCGFSIDSDALPIDGQVGEVAADWDEARELGLFIGEDFELVLTLPEPQLGPAKEASPTRLSVIGEVTAGGISLDGDPLEDRGYTH
jgi:thiamine-monophosphate kinase